MLSSLSYSPFNPILQHQTTNTPNRTTTQSYMNDEIEITKRRKRVLDTIRPWKEPETHDFFYILWKHTNNIERINIKNIDVKFLNDGGTEIYMINDTEFIIPHNNSKYRCSYSLMFNNELLDKSNTSQLLEEYIKNDL